MSGHAVKKNPRNLIENVLALEKPFVDRQGSPSGQLATGQCATLACLLEITSPKPGNVHRGADFAGLTFIDFVASAVAIGPAMERAVSVNLGSTVLTAIQATRRVVTTNTNLGTVLLLAPLAAVPRSEDLDSGVCRILDALNASDAEEIYAAIRLAEPGGMGEVASHDISASPPVDLMAAMSEAATRDLVARQYTNGFRQLLDVVVPWMVDRCDLGDCLTDAVIYTQLRLMNEFPDSLIARKCGREIALESAARAGSALSLVESDKEEFWHAVSDFDFWLRSDGNRRNPGTTADLIAAGLFVALRDQLISPPFC